MHTRWILIFLLGVILLVGGCKPNPGQQGKATVVAVTGLGQVDGQLKDTIIKVIRITYGFSVVDFGKQEMPKQFFVNVKSPRYRADSIIRYLKNTKPDSVDFIIGLTALDISTTKYDDNGEVLKPVDKYTDWGVFGLGYVDGPGCVVSSFRLRVESKKLLAERVKKVAIHELGHNLGLPHCPNKHCVMQDAVEKISTIDNESSELCNDCKREIGLLQQVP